MVFVIVRFCVSILEPVFWFSLSLICLSFSFSHVNDFHILPPSLSLAFPLSHSTLSLTHALFYDENLLGRKQGVRPAIRIKEGAHSR